MNARFTRKPTRHQEALAKLASETAVKLVDEFASEVGDNHEWPNGDNVHNTRVALLAYIADLEP